MGTKKGPKTAKTTTGPGKNAPKPNGRPVARNGAARPIDSLSPKETEVFHLLSRGHSPKKISETLGVGYFTAITHLRRIQRKLDLPNQRRLLVTAIRHGAGLSQL